MAGSSLQLLLCVCPKLTGQHCWQLVGVLVAFALNRPLVCPQLLPQHARTSSVLRTVLLLDHSREASKLAAPTNY